MTHTTEVRAVKFPGIVRDAKALGVPRLHLFQLLSGQLNSPKATALTRRYLELKRQQKGESALAVPTAPVPAAVADYETILNDVVTSLRAVFAERTEQLRRREAEKRAAEATAAMHALTTDRVNEIPAAITDPANHPAGGDSPPTAPASPINL